MRILMLTASHLQPIPDAPEIGGAARQCLKLSKALVKQDVDVTVVAQRVSSRELPREMIDGVPVVRLNAWFAFFNRRGLRRFGIYAFMLRALAYLLRHQDEYDVIHCHSALTSGFVSVLTARWLGKKSVIKVMNSGFRNDIVRFRRSKTIWGARMMADYLVNCDRVIALNELAYEQLVDLGFRRDQIALIPNGVDVTQHQARVPHGNSDTVRVIFVGRLAEAKGLDVLLHALKLVSASESHTDYQLTILGKGILREQLEEMAQRLGIDGRVQLVGQVADVSPYLVDADIFVLPSRAEGISNALLEAMATGLSCIATDIPGNRDLVQDKVNGLLVPTDDARALAEAIGVLGRDPELRKRLGQAARRSIEDRFDIGVVAGRYIELYRSLFMPLT